MWYLLNMNTKISVKTAFGVTEEAEVGDCLGQGTAGAGLVSAANLDLGLQKYFHNTDMVMSYGNVRVQPLSYQDDVGSICSNIEMARKQAEYMTSMLSEKVLHAHPYISVIFLLGCTNFKEKTKKNLKENPVYLDRFSLQRS